MTIEGSGLMIVKEQFIFTSAPFVSAHASTIVELSSGELLCAWFGGTKEGAADVQIWMSHIDSEGWSSPVSVAQAPGVPCWNPVLFQMPSGEVLLFYKAGPSPREWTGFLKRSHDKGQSWSEAQKLPAGVFGPIRNKPYLLENGTLLCGSSVESWKANAVWLDVSPDAGYSWHKLGPITIEKGLYGIIQPALFQDGHGGWKMLCRPREGLRKLCEASSVNGIDWSEARITDLKNPDSSVDAIRTQAGEVLLVCNPTESKRKILSILKSQDGGQTWADDIVLEDGNGEYSYPAIIQDRNGKIHVTYTWERQRIKHVLLE